MLPPLPADEHTIRIIVEGFFDVSYDIFVKGGEPMNTGASASGEAASSAQGVSLFIPALMR